MAELDDAVGEIIQNSVVKEAVANRKRQILESAEYEGRNQDEILSNVKDQIDQVYLDGIDLNDIESGRDSLRIAEEYVRAKPKSTKSISFF